MRKRKPRNPRTVAANSKTRHRRTNKVIFGAARAWHQKQVLDATPRKEQVLTARRARRKLRKRLARM